MTTSTDTAAALRARDRKILALVATGATNREIGTLLHIAENTVKQRLTRHVFPDLGARDRAHAVALAFRRGILPLADAEARS
jgi:DNA-binding NarL/FixJ family response regulator